MGLSPILFYTGTFSVGHFLVSSCFNLPLVSSGKVMTVYVSSRFWGQTLHFRDKNCCWRFFVSFPCVTFFSGKAFFFFLGDEAGSGISVFPPLFTLFSPGLNPSVFPFKVHFLFIPFCPLFQPCRLVSVVPHLCLRWTLSLTDVVSLGLLWCQRRRLVKKHSRTHASRPVCTHAAFLVVLCLPSPLLFCGAACHSVTYLRFCRHLGVLLELIFFLLLLSPSPPATRKSGNCMPG